MRSVFVHALVEEAERDDRIVLLTGDLGFMALEPFRESFPDRFYNVGVAEQNMVGIATGLAEAGFTPFCYSIVPFAALRPYEFIRNGPVLHHLPVRIVGMGGGFDYGTAGPTHYGTEDIGAMRLLQDLAVIAPADSNQAAAAVHALSQWPGPAYLRLSKSEGAPVPGLDGRFEFGRAHQVREGSDVVMFSMGNIALSALSAADRLQEIGISAAVVVLSSINPRPDTDVVPLVSSCRFAVTVEDHVREGGIGSLVAELIADNAASCRLLRLGIKRPFSGNGGSEEFLRRAHGLSPESIASRVGDLLEANRSA